jgi:hypothetical protein
VAAEQAEQQLLRQLLLAQMAALAAVVPETITSMVPA